MRTSRIAVMMLGLLALGCRTDPSQALMERDLRCQEDKIYELEAMLNDCHAARESTVRENEALKRELAGGERGPGSDSRAPSSATPRGDEPRGRSRDESPKLEPPKIELPGPVETPSAEINPGEQGAVVVEGPPTQLVFNKRLTGGLDRDSEPGDEGILVAFEPRDAQGHLSKAPGAVSIALLDPALEGEAGRVARWDFRPDEVPSHFYNTMFGRGLQFELPWPAAPPQHRELRLFVRFTTAEGKKIVADTPIEVRIPSASPQLSRTKTWTESASPKPRPPRAEPESSRSASAPPRESAPPPAASESPDSPDASESQPEPRASEPVRQAARPDRPAWKPYR